MWPGQIIEVNSKDDIVAYSPTGQYNSFMNGILGGVGGLGAGNLQAQANAYCSPVTQEQRDRMGRREKRPEVKRRRIKELMTPKMIKSFSWAIVLAAMSVFFIAFNLSFENHDYNTKLLCAILYFATFLSGGFAILMGFLGFSYLFD